MRHGQAASRFAQGRHFNISAQDYLTHATIAPHKANGVAYFNRRLESLLRFVLWEKQVKAKGASRMWDFGVAEAFVLHVIGSIGGGYLFCQGLCLCVTLLELPL